MRRSREFKIEEGKMMKLWRRRKIKKRMRRGIIKLRRRDFKNDEGK